MTGQFLLIGRCAVYKGALVEGTKAMRLNNSKTTIASDDYWWLLATFAIGIPINFHAMRLARLNTDWTWTSLDHT